MLPKNGTLVDFVLCSLLNFFDDELFTLIVSVGDGGDRRSKFLLSLNGDEVGKADFVIANGDFFPLAGITD